MKGIYNIKKLVLFCILLCGIPATVETIVMFFGIGKVSVVSLAVMVFFLLFLVLWAIQEAVKTPEEEKVQLVEEPWQPLDAREKNPVQAREMAQKNLPAFPSNVVKMPPKETKLQNIPTKEALQPRQPSYIDYTQQQQQEIQTYQKQQDTQFPFSIENLSRIYDFSRKITNDDRKNMLKTFLKKKTKLALTEKAKNEVHNLQKNTPLLTITDDGGAEFFLYDHSYLVPSLETYLSWYGRPYDNIKEELQDRMFNYIFFIEPQNVSRNMSLIKLKPAKVTKVGNEEYLIEEQNKGILFFGNIS